jgi:hypothetical protein
MDKAEVARRQLGTALDMWLRRQDPVSVHCLAMAGGEIAEWLAEKSGGEPFKNHILDTFVDLQIKDVRAIQRQYVNAFKHATALGGKDRDDEEILRSFDDTVNEHVLLTGWYDYGMAGLPRPIEAQVFEAWYLAKYPEKVSPEANTDGLRRIFPNLAALSDDRQHARMGDVIRKAKKSGIVINDPGTDRRPLIMPWGTPRDRVRGFDRRATSSPKPQGAAY